MVRPPPDPRAAEDCGPYSVRLTDACLFAQNNKKAPGRVLFYFDQQAFPKA